jgi:hypothetical protein
LLAIEEGANGAKGGTRAYSDGSLHLSLGAPFQYQGNVAGWKSENLNENTACVAVTVGTPRALTLPSRNAADLLLLRGKHGHFPRIQRERNSLLVRLSGY